MVFVTAGMGGGTGTGAAPVVARCAKEAGILTVGVVTKPFQFEGVRRMRVAEAGITELHKVVDTLLIIPNQNLFRVANEKTTFADAFAMADQVLYSGVACITDLMVKEGLINLDFADVRAVMREMGKAMMGTGEASGEKRALSAAEAAISNPLIDDASMKGAKGLLISITGGKDLTLYEVDEAATRIREEVDQDANIIVGATFDEALEGVIRVSVVATGIDQAALARPITAPEARIAELTQKLRADQVRAEQQRAHDGGAQGGSASGALAAECGEHRERRQGCGRAGRPARGRDHSPDPTKALAVPRATAWLASRRLPRRSSRRRRSACPANRHGACRKSTSCRARAKPSYARTAVRKPRRSLRKSARADCCGALRPSALAVVRRSLRTRKRPLRIFGPYGQPPVRSSGHQGCAHAAPRVHCTSAVLPAAPGARAPVSEYAKRPAHQPSIRSAGRRAVYNEEVSSTSRLSCAGRRIDPLDPSLLGRHEMR